MALPAPQLIDALVGTLEDPANQSARLATALRDSADTYSEAETDQKIQDAINALPSTGDVTGPAGAVVGNLAVFDNVSGKVLADSLVPIVDVEDAVEKAGFLTVTQPVDLDAMEARVNQLDAAVILKGTWDASAGTFPGGGTAQAGESWIVSVTGTVGGVAFTANDRIIAITDNASTTVFANNWFKADYTDLVQSVNGSTGAVTIEAIIHAATGKTTPVDADELGLVDSAASNVLKRVTWANVKATLKAYFDAIYGALATANQWTKPQRSGVKVLTSGTSVSIDAADGNDYELPLAHNATVGNFANASSYIGMKGSIIVTQTVGGNTIGFASNWKFMGTASTPSAPTALNAVFAVDFHIVSATLTRANLRGVGTA